MVAPNRRSRTFLRVKIRAPKGDVRTHYHRRKPGVPQCAHCGNKLQGVPRTRAMHRVNASSRRPERPYGGQLCSQCTRKLIIQKARERYA